MKTRVNQAVKIEADSRYMEHNRAHSIKNVYDALVELITNADDSYNRLFKKKKIPKDGGNILIEHSERRKDQPSRIIVRDRAEGMDSSTMESCFRYIGRYSSEQGSRGYMGRGAKDCSVLGDLTFESIKDNRYYECKITHDFKFVLLVDRGQVSETLRDKLGVPRGNGTSVTLSLNKLHTKSHTLPRFDSLSAKLPNHFALRDLMSEKSSTQVKLKRGNERQSLRLVYRPPEGILVHEDEFDVPGYVSARAKLCLYRSAKDLTIQSGESDRFERSGLLVKGKRAIHECSWPSESLRKDPHAQRYHGRLDCDFIDDLMAEYENRMQKGEAHGEHNPSLVIDPNRRGGLDRSHPFVQELFRVAAEKVEAVIKKHRDQQDSRTKEIANKRTKERLGRLAKLAGRYLKSELEELEETGGPGISDETLFSKQGVLLWPEFARVNVNEKRRMTLYVKRDLISDSSPSAIVTSDSPAAAEVKTSQISLGPHPKRNGCLIGSFDVFGHQVIDVAVITARCGDSPPAESALQVLDDCQQPRVFGAPLEFDHATCTVQEGKSKSIQLFAQCPELVDRTIPVRVLSSDAQKVEIYGSTFLKPVEGTNFAEGKVKIRGRVLHSRTKVIAELGKYKAEIEVIVAKSREEPGVPLDIRIVNEDFEGARAVWNVRENKPHQLLVSGRHISIARYLGAPQENYPGQNTPLVRAILAEIVADNVIRKLLPLQAEERPGDFSWNDHNANNVIADDVLTQYAKRLGAFVSGAHRIMVDDSELDPVSEETVHRSREHAS